MDLVNAVGIIVSFGGVAVLTLWIIHKRIKYMRKREQEIMSTISAIQYSQLKGEYDGNHNGYDGLDNAVSEDVDDFVCDQCHSDRSNKCG